jgi:hypothetical protein
MDKLKAIAGGGAWMIAVALQVVPQTWPNFLHPHPWAVAAFVIIGGAMFAYAAISGKRSSGSKNSGNIVGRDNSGKMIAHVEHYHEAPSPDRTDPPKPEPPQHPIADVPPKISPQQLRLELGFERMSLIYRVEQSAWDTATQFEYDGRESIVAWFTNPVPPKGVRGIEAMGLSAHIRYSVEGHWKTQVSRGYWLHWSENEITINAADRAGLILGFVYFSHWVSYANPYSTPASEGILQPAFRPPGQESKMPIVDMDIEISLLTNGKFTLDQQKVRLCFSQGHPYAVRVP